MSKYRIIISAILIFYSVFFEVVGINPTLIGQTKNLALFIFLLYNREMFSVFFKYKYVNFVLLIFCGVILYSGWINQIAISDISVESYNTNIKYAKSVRFDHQLYIVLKIFSTTLFIEFLNQKGGSLYFIKWLFSIFAIWGIVVFFDGLINYHEDGDGYLVGNKFDVTYYNIYVIVLYALIFPLQVFHNKIKCLVLLLISILLCLRISCMTSMLAYFSLYFLLFLSERKKRSLCKNKFFLITIFLTSTVLFFFSNYVLSGDVAKFVLVDVLGRDQTLTSRTNIYAMISTVIASSPLWGYGIGNYYTVCLLIIGAPNAQNGLANLVVEIGYIGMITFVILQLMLFNNKSNCLRFFPIIVYVYVFFIISSVEIPFNLHYFCFSSLLLLKPDSN